MQRLQPKIVVNNSLSERDPAPGRGQRSAELSQVLFNFFGRVVVLTNIAGLGRGLMPVGQNDVALS